jgi:hypothetical protein
MTPLYSRILAALLRAALVGYGGSALDEGQLEQLIGALMIVIGIGWSIFDKRNRKPEPQVATEFPSTSPYQGDLADRKPFKPYGKNVR